MAPGLARLAATVGLILLLRDPVAYVTLYAAFGFSWSAMQYVHHFGTVRDVKNGARNLRLFAPIDAIWLNHNWHLTHHRHPTMPWPHLPALAREEQRRFELLIAHWDVPLNHIDLDARKPGR